MKTQRIIGQILTAVLFGISCAKASAVTTSISRQGTDNLLGWPSVPGQQFTVQFRESFDTGSGWTTLTNGLSAAIGTNYTTYIHEGVLPAGGAQMQAEGAAAAQKAQLSPVEMEAKRAQRKAEADKTIAWLKAQLDEAASKATAWREEVAKNPALLEAVKQQAASAPATALNSSSGC